MEGGRWGAPDFRETDVIVTLPVGLPCPGDAFVFHRHPSPNYSTILIDAGF